MTVKIPDGERLHMLKHIIPELSLEALGDPDHDPRLYEAGDDTGNDKACRNKNLMCKVCKSFCSFHDTGDIDIQKCSGKKCAFYGHAEYRDADT